MPKPRRADAPLDDERPVVQRAMVGAAERDEIVGVMGAVLGARCSVVNIDERCVPATGHSAATAVAPQHVTAHRRRNGLLGTRGAKWVNRHGSIAASASDVGVANAEVSVR